MIFKRIAALVLTVVMAAVSFAGCAKSYDSIVTVNGTDIQPSMYLYAQYIAFLEASELALNPVDFLSETIEEMPAKEWIHNKTIEILKKYVWVEEKFAELGVELTSADTDYIDYEVEYYWPVAESLMAENGIGKDAYTNFMRNEYLSQYVVFQELYGAGGEFEPTDDEVVEYMDSKYARIKGFKLSKVMQDTGSFVSAQGLADLYSIATAAVSQLNEGADFGTVIIDSLRKAAEINGDTTVYADSDALSYSLEKYLSKENVDIYEKLFVENAFSMDENSGWKYDDTQEEIVVYQRMKNLQDQFEIDYYKLSLTYEMCSGEYDDYIQQQTASYEVVENADAVKYYSVEKVK